MHLNRLYTALFTAPCLFFLLTTEAAVISVTNTNGGNTSGSLAEAILSANNGDTIDCTSISGLTISLTASLPAITKSIIIEGANVTIDGGTNYQAFQAAAGTVAINDVSVVNALSLGGNGSDGILSGGGAVGGGGALYVHGGTNVTLAYSSMSGNKAQGGNGGSNAVGGSGSGGGGFGGGNGESGNSVASGGGGGHSGGGAGSGSTVTPGGNGTYFGGAGGGAASGPSVSNAGNAGPSLEFTGGVSVAFAGGGGAGAGGNGGDPIGTNGGIGGLGIGLDLAFGGGGGGGCSGIGGDGIGAGGGGAGDTGGGAGGSLGGGGGSSAGGLGGAGGFGAGGGSGASGGGSGGGGYGAGGGLGGIGIPSAGGGGSGLGGAIFVQNEATLTIVNAESIANNEAVSGLGGIAAGGASDGGDGASMGQDIFLRQGGAIIFSLDSSLSLENPIEGNEYNAFDGNGGGVSKTGAGILSLNGAQTYLGQTTVDEGIINLNGSVIGDLVVNTIGGFSGNAVIGGSITNSGTLYPGNSIGTITTQNNLNLTSTSILDMELDANGQSDLIQVANSAQLDGSLTATLLPGIYPASQTYTIITAGDSVTGQFALFRVVNGGQFLANVIYNPTDVKVTLLPFSSTNLTGNALEVATAFVALPHTSGPGQTNSVYNALFSINPLELNGAFNQMQPAQFSALAWTQFQNSLSVRSSYSQYMEQVRSRCTQDGYYLWVDGLGEWLSQKNQGQQFGYHNLTGGVVCGIDMVKQPFEVGAVLSYTHSSLHWDESAGNSTVNSYYGGLYGSWGQELFYINGTVLGAYSCYFTDRHIRFSTLDLHAEANHNSWEFLAGFEMGANLHVHSVEVSPFVRSDYLYLHQQSYQENNAYSLNLKIPSREDQLLQNEVGVVFSKKYFLCFESPTVVPRLKLSYINLLSLSGRNYTASFINSDEQFSVEGLSMYKNLAGLSAGVTCYNTKETVGFTIRYDGEFGSKYWSQSANARLDFKF